MLLSSQTPEQLPALLLRVCMPSTEIPGATIGAYFEFHLSVCLKLLPHFISRYTAACMLGCNSSALSIPTVSETAVDSWNREVSAGMRHYKACSAAFASCGWSPGAILQLAVTKDFAHVCSLVQVCSHVSVCFELQVMASFAERHLE